MLALINIFGLIHFLTRPIEHVFEALLMIRFLTIGPKLLKNVELNWLNCGLVSIVSRRHFAGYKVRQEILRKVLLPFAS
jgi:hypothetical protein